MVETLRRRVEEAHRLLEIRREVFPEEERIAFAERILDCGNATVLVERANLLDDLPEKHLTEFPVWNRHRAVPVFVNRPDSLQITRRDQERV